MLTGGLSPDDVSSKWTTIEVENGHGLLVLLATVLWRRLMSANRVESVVGPQRKTSGRPKSLSTGMGLKNYNNLRQARVVDGGVEVGVGL